MKFLSEVSLHSVKGGVTGVRTNKGLAKGKGESMEAATVRGKGGGPEGGVLTWACEGKWQGAVLQYIGKRQGSLRAEGFGKMVAMIPSL